MKTSRLKELIAARRRNRSWEGQARDADGRWTKEDVVAAARNYKRQQTIREILRESQAELVARQQKKQKILTALKNYGRRLKIREELRQQEELPAPFPILKTPEEYIKKGREFLKAFPALQEYSDKIAQMHGLMKQATDPSIRHKYAKRVINLDREIEDLRQKMPAIARSIGDNLLVSSPLSAHVARQLVDSINISHDELLGGDESEIEQTKNEVAFMHQILGANIPALKDIKIDLLQRPHANHAEGLIVHNLLYGDDTIPHEMCHFLEYQHPEVAVANNLWLQKRATGSPQQLNDLTGNKNLFREDEIAYPDAFFHPYVGKVYSPRINVGNNLIPATEVLSMGMDRVIPIMMAYNKSHHIKAFTSILEKDPEHLELTLGTILYLQEKNRRSQ